MDYNEMRHLADSWGLVYLMVVFIAAAAFTFRPWARKSYEEAAKIPLKED